jgi:hypothetical protein
MRTVLFHRAPGKSDFSGILFDAFSRWAGIIWVESTPNPMDHGHG